MIFRTKVNNVLSGISYTVGTLIADEMLPELMLSGRANVMKNISELKDSPSTFLFRHPTGCGIIDVLRGLKEWVWLCEMMPAKGTGQMAPTQALISRDYGVKKTCSGCNSRTCRHSKGIACK